jgi:outer membrane usher protein FimD/PapC
MLGFGGHCTTKSRHYSITFAALRAARRAFNARRRHGPTVALDPHGGLLPTAGTVAVAGWEYAGRGYTTLADAWLAASMAADHQEARRLAREELNRVA